MFATLSSIVAGSLTALSVLSPIEATATIIALALGASGLYVARTLEDATAAAVVNHQHEEAVYKIAA